SESKMSTLSRSRPRGIYIYPRWDAGSRVTTSPERGTPYNILLLPSQPTHTTIVMTSTSALTIVAVAIVACCLSPLGSVVSARNLEPLSTGAMAKLLGGASFQPNSIAKRNVFDPTCKGIYNREIFGRLNHVCEDCYNLYRDPSVAVKCRSDCFGNATFEQCLYDLLRQNEAEDFSKIIRTLGK
ncbi:unnamed protein product, partial [Meganyctiphanes norvegica]